MLEASGQDSRVPAFVEDKKKSVVYISVRTDTEQADSAAVQYHMVADTIKKSQRRDRKEEKVRGYCFGQACQEKPL